MMKKPLNRTLRYYENGRLILEEDVIIVRQEEWRPGYLRVWYRRANSTMRPEDTMVLEGRVEQFVITDYMRDEYDFSIAVKNPYGKELK